MDASIAVLASCLLVASAGDDSVEKAPELGKRIVGPFDYRGVTLDAGPLKKQVDEVRAFYLAIPDDSLLKGFRTRAGKPAPGKDLGGWYSSDTFLVFGQIVSGLARLHAATGDPACRNKANRLIEEWAKCIEPDGYFYASRKPNAPHYIYDKMLWGLLDAHSYCGNREALVHLFRDAETLYVNLFTPSTVKWEQEGEAVTLAQTTIFPASNEVRLTLSLRNTSEFGIKVRTPDWLAAPIEASVNGHVANLQVDARHWTGLRRPWRDGDVVALRLPMKLQTSRLDPERPTPVAVLYGPVVLAFEAPSAKCSVMWTSWPWSKC